MFLSFLMMLFLFLIVMGFARVVRYFWGWLRGGEKVDEDLVRREDVAEERAEEVADRDLEGIDTEDGPEQVVTLVRARADEINAYLDAMSLGWYQIAIVFFIGCMAGLLLEEIWMLITAGLAQNRVGLVWGPFSPLYGFGAVFLTVVSFELRRHGARGWQVFLVAAIIGGLLEQITGWSMETALQRHVMVVLAPARSTSPSGWPGASSCSGDFLAWCGIHVVMPVLLYPHRHAHLQAPVRVRAASSPCTSPPTSS